MLSISFGGCTVQYYNVDENADVTSPWTLRHPHFSFSSSLFVLNYLQYASEENTDESYQCRARAIVRWLNSTGFS